MEGAQRIQFWRQIYWVGAGIFIALLSSALLHIFLLYQERKDTQIRIQREQAVAAAKEIDQLIGEIVSQIGWTTQLPRSESTLEARRFDGLRLLRQAPSIVNLMQLDAAGKNRLCTSRLLLGECGEGRNFSQDPKFTEAVAKKVYYGPIYFRRESEPYMTISVAGTRRDAGVTVAEVSLKRIWDIISELEVSQHGLAYVIDARGRLIAHPDIRLVLGNTDMSKLPHVRAVARGETVQEGEDLSGRKVLAAYAPIYRLRWFVFVEQPSEEAYAPVFESIRASMWLLGALMLALFGIAWITSHSGRRVSRKMVGPGEVAQ